MHAELFTLRSLYRELLIPPSLHEQVPDLSPAVDKGVLPCFLDLVATAPPEPLILSRSYMNLHTIFNTIDF